tara:strand:- start:1984 stop:2211 length:228 start_codon:yes stop_codon:yes gene_type:complete
LDDLAAKVGVHSGHSLNTMLNRKTINANLRKRCLSAGIPDAVLPPATKSKSQLEKELREAYVQLSLCWDALHGGL